MKSTRGLDCFCGKPERKRVGDIMRRISLGRTLENKYGE